MSQPLAIDLYCGLGGWTEGLQAEGYRVVGFDNMQHVYGDARYPAQLVIQDVLTLHGRQFKDAALIVASPPCQEFSYMAMPWTRAKEKAAALRDGRDDPKRLTALFEACFRIQREASEAAGRHIPLVVENVCGAQKWVGRARWHYGSFYLWGDVPALMPITRKHVKVPTMGAGWYPPDHPKHVPGLAFNGHADRNLRAMRENHEIDQRRSSTDAEECSLRSAAAAAARPSESLACGSGTDQQVSEFASPMSGRDRSETLESLKATKNNGGFWFNVAHNTTSGHGQNPDGRNTSLCIHGVRWSEECRECGIWRVYPDTVKIPSESGRRTDVGNGVRFTSRDCGIENTVANAQDGHKQRGSGAAWWRGDVGSKGSKSSARKAAKAASAHIAKIPIDLARHIGRAWWPL